MTYTPRKNVTSEVSRLIDSRTLPMENVLEKARALLAIERKLHSCLDAEICGHVRCGNLEDGVLTLLTPSSAIASSLRVRTHEILNSLESLGVDNVAKLVLRIVPPGELYLD